MVPNQAVIRQASLSDSAAIAEVLRESFEEFRTRFDPPSGAIFETAASILSHLRDASAFIAEVDGRIAGVVFCKPTDSGELYLFRLGVLPGRRKQGLGKALVRAVEQKASEEGFAGVRLSTRLGVPENLLFYERMGYMHERDMPHPNSSSAVPVLASFVKELR